MKIYQMILVASCLGFSTIQGNSNAPTTLPVDPNRFGNYTSVTTNHNSIQVSINGFEEFGKCVNRCLDACINLKKKCKEQATFDHLASWCKKHRLAIVSCALLGAYALIAKKLAGGRLVIHNSAAWANWKNHANLDDLINSDSRQLSRDLHLSIMSKYNNNNQADTITPLALFSKDVDQELVRLRKFIQVSHYLKISRTNRLFFVSEKEVALVQEKIHRLLYLKKIIIESMQLSLT